MALDARVHAPSCPCANHGACNLAIDDVSSRRWHEKRTLPVVHSTMDDTEGPVSQTEEWAAARTSSLPINSSGRTPLVPDNSDGLTTITGLGSVTQELELFREQIAQHVASVAVSFETADQQLKDLFTAVTSSHEKLKATTAKADVASESARNASAAVEDLTARLKKAEAALDVLPVWKSAYEAKGKAAEEAAKAREREAAARCDRLESLIEALQTRLSQRFESLEDIVMKGSEARSKQAEDILKLKSDSVTFREGLAAADTTLRTLKAASSNHARKLDTAASDALQTAAQLRVLQDQTNALLNTSEDLAATTTRLATSTDLASSGLDVIRSDFEESERTIKEVKERIQALEEDTRAQDALEATKDIAEFGEDIERFQKELDEGIAELEARIEQVSEAEAGPQALQDLLQTSEELNASTQAAHEKLGKLESRLAATKSSIDAQTSLGEAAMAAAGDAGRAAASLGARLDAEAKRLTSYCDRATQPLARTSQVDEVRDQIKALKAQFIEDAEHTKDEIKFDLMHEKSPQVSTLKDLLAQQERNTARLSERLTLAEEAASLARADAAESSGALAALHAENASHQEGGCDLRNQVTALSTRVHELKSLANQAQQEAQAASHAVAIAAARDVTLSREQVDEIVDLAAAKARQGAHPSWALSTPGALRQGPHSEADGLGTLQDRIPGADGALDQQASDPSFMDAENSPLQAPSSVQSTGRGRAAALLALRATKSGAESVWGASETLDRTRHTCVSQEHAVLAKDIATSLLDLHKKSRCSQAFNDYVQVVENDYSVIKSQKEHCKLMKGVNTVLDRLTRKRASNAADFTVTCVAVQEMRLCLLERVVAKVQDSLKDVAQAASRAGKVADSAALEASQKVPATLGSEMLAGMHALVRILGEALVAGLSHEGLAAMKQVVENKVHTYMSTHGPKLKHISQQALVKGAAPFRDRSNSPPPQNSPTRSPNTGQGTSASSGLRNSLAPGALSPHARGPGRISGVEGGGRNIQGGSGYVGAGPKRPFTAGAAVQSSPIKAPADALIQTLVENTSPQRRVRSAHPQRAMRQDDRVSPTAFFHSEQQGHPGAPGVPSMRPPSAVNASFYRSRRDLVAEHEVARANRMQGTRPLSSHNNNSGGGQHDGLTESLDISPLAPAAPRSS